MPSAVKSITSHKTKRRGNPNSVRVPNLKLVAHAVSENATQSEAVDQVAMACQSITSVRAWQLPMWVRRVVASRAAQHEPHSPLHREVGNARNSAGSQS
jgi:hypothetical protein